MMSSNWKHIKTVPDGFKFKIKKLNVWDYDWIATNQRVIVKDPLYGQEYCMTIYEIHHNEKVIEFAAGEFSNCMWGFYQKDK
ncbi:hypothetical protein [Draconibacterium mangrovi]|uniref:hypothetical protein n=1 Tax=Draconibacterium mangrovi TaxID=2697469 RepID=UPI0013CF5939|nr:hypothetical protein [Draconibacterium mangrovi]